MAHGLASFAFFPPIGVAELNDESIPDRVALTVVHQLRYSPAMARDRSVRVEIRVPIDFTIR